MGQLDFEKNEVEVKTREYAPGDDAASELSSDDMPGLSKMYSVEKVDWTQDEVRRLVRK